jgi:hypothetical protein
MEAHSIFIAPLINQVYHGTKKTMYMYLYIVFIVILLERKGERVWPAIGRILYCQN